MPSNPPNLDWVRSLKLQGHPEFGPKLYELLNSYKGNFDTLEQQGNFNLQGQPTAPPQPDGLTVVPHPSGVQYAIHHNADFYQGIEYRIDCTSAGVTHTYDVGTSRNGVIPNGKIAASYQVRALYPSGKSSSPRVLNGLVTGGSGSSSLLPSQAEGTTKPGQPPGFGGPYRGSTPPVRNA